MPKKSTQKIGDWSATRKHLAKWDTPTLLSLVKDLYALAPKNRDFIEARSQPEAGGGAVLEVYREKVTKQFFPKRGSPALKLGEARKAIREYRKATQSLPGTAELLMTYVETGVKFTLEYGDIDARFYDSLESAFNELATLLRDKARELYPTFEQRLAKIEERTDGMGWGFHDYISQVVGELEKEFSDSAAPRRAKVTRSSAPQEAIPWRNP